MKVSLERIWFFLFSNYMWLYLIMGVCTICGFYPMTFQLLMFVSSLFFVKKIINIRDINVLDILVLSFSLWIVINSILIDYPHKWRIWYTAVVLNVLPMLFYFIAKTVTFDVELLLRKTTIPMIIAMVCGLYFYFTNPDWYVQIKYNQIYEHYNGDMRDEVIISVFRLSSLWVTPYVIGYAALFYANYLIYKIFSISPPFKNRTKYFLLLILTTAVILLTQFRTTIFALVLSLIYVIFFAKNKINLSYVIIVSLICVFGVVLLFDQSTEIGQYFKERMIEGLSTGHLEERLEHTGGEVDLSTIEGQGFGRYGSIAREYDYWAIQDSEYQKVLAELGYVGIIPFVGLIVTGLLMSFRKKRMQLEFTIILFFAIAFVGSSCISAETTFPFIFWYVLGRISYKSSEKISKNYSLCISRT